MRLFNRAKEEVEDENATTEVHTVPNAKPDQNGGKAVPSPTASSDAPQAEDTAVLDATVKEMSEKLARLSSSLESVGTERQGFEEKIERMEDRMRKLSSLTEMLSAQYNPFIGDVPAERAQIKANGASAALAPVAETPQQAPASVEAQSEAAAAPVPEAAEQEPLDEPEAPKAEWVAADAEDDGVVEDAAVAASAGAEATSGWRPEATHLERVAPTFQNNMLLLNWSSMLLKAAHSREGLRQIVDYYQGLGWIGEKVRDELLLYAEGLACDADEDAAGAAGDWRAHAELHERSLLFIEKLKGGAP